MNLKKISIITFAFFFISSGFLIGQENTSISDSRKENVKKLMNYRFKGGYYTFEKLFYAGACGPFITFTWPITQSKIGSKETKKKKNKINKYKIVPLLMA